MKLFAIKQFYANLIGTANLYDERWRRVYRRLAFRKGAAIAKAAVARNPAVRLYILLRDGTDDEEICRRGPAGRGQVRMPGSLGMYRRSNLDRDAD